MDSMTDTPNPKPQPTLHWATAQKVRTHPSAKLRLCPLTCPCRKAVTS